MFPCLVSVLCTLIVGAQLARARDTMPLLSLLWCFLILGLSCLGMLCSTTLFYASSFPCVLCFLILFQTLMILFLMYNELTMILVMMRSSPRWTQLLICAINENNSLWESSEEEEGTPLCCSPYLMLLGNWSHWWCIYTRLCHGHWKEATMRSSPRWNQLLVNELEQFTLSEFRGGRGDVTLLLSILYVAQKLKTLLVHSHLTMPRAPKEAMRRSSPR